MKHNCRSTRAHAQICEKKKGHHAYVRRVYQSAAAEGEPKPYTKLEGKRPRRLQGEHFCSQPFVIPTHDRVCEH
eukprot:8402614-Karenia_brevis.AAC.1